MRYIDGFEIYSAAGGETTQKDVLCRWQNGYAVMVPGRNGNGFSGTLGKTIDHQNNWTVGFAIIYTTLGGGPFGSPYQLCHAGTVLCGLYGNLDSTLSLFAGNTQSPTYQIGTTSRALHESEWYYFEVSIQLSGTNPISVTGEVRINGQTVIGPATAVSNINASDLLLQTTTANYHIFSSLGNATTITDDLYIFDGNGIFNNTFAGDNRVGVLLPNSDYSIGAWTPTGGGASYTQINEVTPDYDTTYLESNTVSASDMFGFPNLTTFSGKIIGVQFSALARKDDEGLRTIKLLSDSGVPASAEMYLGDGYEYYMMQSDSPDGINPWALATFNGTAWGFEVYE